ncbi:CHASE4 domain-containing protein [Aeromonas hydrophila]
MVQAELGPLTMLGQDWSEWDETCAYMVSRDPVYLAANLNVRTFETLGVDLVALYDADKQPQAAFAYHGGQLVTQTPAQLAPLTDYLVRNGSLKPNAGIWFDGERYYLLAATQILTS